MAASDSDFEEAGRFSAKLDDMQPTYDENDMLQEDTNVLNLDEEQSLGSPVDESEIAEAEMMEDEDEDEGPELSPDGILDEETIARGFSNLGRSADGTQQVFLHLTLPGYKLTDINLLQDCVHIQKLEIPHNEITDLSALSYMPYLLELDASHNLLGHLLDFAPPKNLKSANFSYNQIEEMGDLSDHHYLTKLVIDHNQITEIKGLQNCKRLSHLSMAHNKIAKIRNVDHLPLKYLDLSNNQLEKIENLESLRFLQTVKLAGNVVRSLSGLQDHEFLEVVDMEGNEIIDLSEIQHVKSLRLLRDLNLLRNPIRELPDYRLSILFHLQKLSELDRRKVDVCEKVAAANMFNPPMEVIASRDHIMHVVYSFLQPSRVLDSTLPSIETPYPMLVLCGPQGAGKKDLALKLVDEFPDYFGYGVSHTTRKPYPEETDGKDYNFVTIDQFENDVKMGKFLQTYSYHGNLYGLTVDSIESVARDGLACVLHMELEGVLTLKNTYFEPRYVLIMPLNNDAHEKRLQERGVYSESQMNWTLNRADMYADYNRNHPGFFDMMINSDDITDAYRRLRRLVMDYLGITPTSPSDNLGQSNATSAFGLEKEVTEMTAAGSAMGGRTWSKASLPDSASQAMGNMRPKTISPMPMMGKSIVEEESLRRRQDAAKDAVAGNKPSLYEQILLEAPRTVPQSVEAQLGLGDEDTMRRAYSAPGHGTLVNGFPLGSPDSSDNRSGSGSSLSNLSEAEAAAETPVDSLEAGSVQGAGDNVLPNEAVDPIELLSSTASKSNGLMAPRPGTAERPRSRISELAGSRPTSAKVLSRPASNMSTGRPGSNRHPVLPPISPQNSQTLPNY